MTSLRTATLATPLGRAVAAATDEGICLLELGPDERVDRQLDALEVWLGAEAVVDDDDHLKALANELEEYFAGTLREFGVALHTPGTPFQNRVWEALRGIPFGETHTYRQIAEKLGAPSAVRAVGGANGANRVSIVIPCHRVIGADGSMTGYSGGVDLKHRLLEHERRNLGVSLWSA